MPEAEDKAKRAVDTVFETLENVADDPPVAQGGPPPAR